MNVYARRSPINPRQAQFYPGRNESASVPGGPGRPAYPSRATGFAKSAAVSYTEVW